MNAITLLTRTSPPVLTPAEDALLARELSAAYHLDEAAATNPEVQRISEKIRLRMQTEPDPNPLPANHTPPS
jgi:hypothetical protein